MAACLIAVTSLLASLFVQGTVVVGESDDVGANGSDFQRTSSDVGAIPSDRCFRLPVVPAQCKSDVVTASRSWFYDARSSSCRQLPFDECSLANGADNGFETLEECIANCLRQPSSEDGYDIAPKQSSNKRPMLQVPLVRSYSSQQQANFDEVPVQRSGRGRSSVQPQETGTLRTITIMMPVRFNEGVALPYYSPENDVSENSRMPLNSEMSRSRAESSYPKQFSVMTDTAQPQQERRLASNRQSSQDGTSAVLAGSLPLPVTHKFFIPALMAQAQQLVPRDLPTPMQQQPELQQRQAKVRSGLKPTQQQQRQQQLVQLPWSQQHQQQAQLVTLPWQRQSVPQRPIATSSNRLPDSAVIKNDVMMTSISYGLVGGRSSALTPEMNQRFTDDVSRPAQRYPFIGFAGNRLMPIQNSGIPMAAVAAGSNRHTPYNRGLHQVFVEEEENLPPVDVKQQMIAFDSNRRAGSGLSKPQRRLPPSAARIRQRSDDDDDDDSRRKDFEYDRYRPTEQYRRRSSTRRSSYSSRSRLSSKRESSSKRYQKKSSRSRESKRNSWQSDTDRLRSTLSTRYDSRPPIPLPDERYDLNPLTSGKLTMFQIVVRRQHDIAHQGFVQPPQMMHPLQQQQQQQPRNWSPIDTLTDALMQTNEDLAQPPVASTRGRSQVQPFPAATSSLQRQLPIADARMSGRPVDDDDDDDDDSPTPVVIVENDVADDVDQPSYVCFLPVDIGNCKSYQNKWFFNAESGRCEMFFYGGCGGNGNRFEKLESCQRTCTPRDIKLAQQSSPGNQSPIDNAASQVSTSSRTSAEPAAVVSDDVISTSPEPERQEQTTQTPNDADVIIVTSPVYVPMTVEELEEYERSTQAAKENQSDVQGQDQGHVHGHSVPGSADVKELAAEHDNQHIASGVQSAAVPGFSTQYIAIVSILGAVGLVVIILVIVTIARLCRRYYKSKKEMVVEDVMKAHMYGDLPQVVYTQTAGVIGKLDEKL